MLQKKTKAMIFNSIARSENQQLTSCLTIDLHFERKKEPAKIRGLWKS